MANKKGKINLNYNLKDGKASLSFLLAPKYGPYILGGLTVFGRPSVM